MARGGTFKQEEEVKGQLSSRQIVLMREIQKGELYQTLTLRGGLKKGGKDTKGKEVWEHSSFQTGYILCLEKLLEKKHNSGMLSGSERELRHPKRELKEMTKTERKTERVCSQIDGKDRVIDEYKGGGKPEDIAEKGRNDIGPKSIEAQKDEAEG